MFFNFFSVFIKCVPVKSWYILNNIIMLNSLKTDIEFLSFFIKKQSLLQCKTLISITGIDYITRYNRFELVYDFLSIHYNLRINIKVYANELDSSFNSLTSIFSCSGWWEREIWDMFGLFFKNNLDLRRILTDYGFIGFPLRKDFPLSGFSELSYNFLLKTCFYSQLELSRIPKNILSYSY